MKETDRIATSAPEDLCDQLEAEFEQQQQRMQDGRRVRAQEQRLARVQGRKKMPQATIPNKQFDFDFSNKVPQTQMKEIESTVADTSKNNSQTPEQQMSKSRHFQSQDLAKKLNGHPEAETTKELSATHRHSVFANRYRKRE